MNKVSSIMLQIGAKKEGKLAFPLHNPKKPIENILSYLHSPKTGLIFELFFNNYTFLTRQF